MPKELIDSRWRDIFGDANNMPDLHRILIECITLATYFGYNVSEIAHALHWQVEEALYDYDVGCVLSDKEIGTTTNRERLSQLPLEELLGIISDGQDQCIIYSLGHKDVFVLNDCNPHDDVPREHCRKCIIKWLDERS